MDLSIQDNMVKGLRPNVPSIFACRVTRVYSQVYCCDVEDLTSGKMYLKVPISMPYAGNNESLETYGLIMHPTEGDIVVVALLNNSDTAPVIISRIFTGGMAIITEDKDDFIFKHKSGTKIKISAAGDVSITPVAGANVLLNGSGSSEGVPLGDSLKSWLDSHTHSTGVGPSGTALQGSSPAPSSVVKVI